MGKYELKTEITYRGSRNLPGKGSEATANEARFHQHLLQETITVLQGLPQALNYFLENPRPTTQEIADKKDLLMALPNSALLPQNSPIIHEGLVVLKEHLDPATNSGSTRQQQETAAMLADILLHQTSLPMDEKRIIRTNRTAAKRGAQAIFGIIPEETSTSEQAAFVEDVSQLARAALDKRDNSTPQVNSEDSALELMRDFNDRIETETEAIILKHWLQTGSPQLTQEYRDGMDRIRDTITGSTVMQELLIQGRLPEVRDDLATVTIARVWEPRFNDPPDIDRADYTSAARFLLENPQLHTRLWHLLLNSEPATLNADGRQRANNENLTKVAPLAGMIEWFLLQDHDLLDPFLESLGTNLKDKNHLSRITRKVVGVAAIMKTRLPDHPNSAAIGASMAEIFDRVGIDPNITAEQIGILDDKAPGVIYLTMDQEARVRSPRRNQSGEDFRQEQEKQPGVVVYSSKVIHIPEQGSKEVKPSLEITGTVVDLPGWRETVVPEPEQVEGILTWMGKKIDTTSEASLDLLAGYMELIQVVGREERPNALFPPLLPEKHPLRELVHAGVLAIENTGGEIRVIVDSKRADLKAAASKVLLTGRLNQHAELGLDDAGEEAALEPLPMILNAAVVYGEIKTQTDQELPRDEIREVRVRGLTKSWNAQARKAGYPQVEYDADPKTIEGTGGVVLPIEIERANRRRATRLTLIR